MTSHTHDPERCRELLAQLNDYVDGELADELCGALEQHLGGCRDCRVVLDTLTRTVALYRGLRELPATLPPGLEQRLIQQLTERA